MTGLVNQQFTFSFPIDFAPTLYAVFANTIQQTGIILAALIPTLKSNIGNL